MDITYSDGRVIQDAVIVIEEDFHNEALGYFRAYWADNPTASLMSPVVGYCSSGGSYKTINVTAAHARRLHPGVKIYRHGREVK